MENEKKVVRLSVGISNNWLPLFQFSENADIDEKVQVLHCDTRDFHIIGSDENPKVYEKPDCNYEYWRNEGLSKLYNLLSKSNRENYAISSNEIIPWLFKLCEATGGFDKNWRYVDANVKNCTSWNLKYIRFVKNDKCKDEYIVCNSYLMPIKYKEIIQNLYKDQL
ncbi:MAG: hypothetical protein IKO56_10590 [Alphaproteobacteria bacterium]|nr:hypothetical protein [Alphaproteobacteria bacterium]